MMNIQNLHQTAIWFVLALSWISSFSLGFTIPSSCTVHAHAVVDTDNKKGLAGPVMDVVVSCDNDDRNDSLALMVKSVNYFISRKCNYNCKFCFHTAKTNHHLRFEEARRGLQMLRAAGTEKINFAGGEPFMNPTLLGELCQASHELGMAVSIISNGSMITPRWMKTYGWFVDILGVSADTFHPATNFLIGRGGDADNNHISRVFRVRDLCVKHGIIFKLNTVICSLNWQEDMTDQVRELDPKRWKAFQVLILQGENSGMVPGELRDARPLLISDEQFWNFCDRHSSLPQLIPEPNNVMQNSYLSLDEELRFLDCSKGGKVPSDSILKVGVEHAVMQSGFDHSMFQHRGGVYEWKRNRSGGARFVAV